MGSPSVKIDVHLHGPVTINIAADSAQPARVGAEVRINTSNLDDDKIMAGLTNWGAKQSDKRTQSYEPAPKPALVLDVELRDGGAFWLCAANQGRANGLMHFFAPAALAAATTVEAVNTLLESHAKGFAAQGFTEASIWQGRAPSAVTDEDYDGHLLGGWKPAE